MPRTSIVLAATLASLVLATAAPSSAKDAPGSGGDDGGPFLEALARVPFSSAARDSLVSYLDQTALIAARAGAAQPERLADVLAALEQDDPAAELWLAAMMGASSGDPELLRAMPQAGDWPARLGFDLLDVDQQLTFGTPPADGTVLLGRFDREAIEAAHAQRGYVAEDAGERRLLCAAAGCDAGMVPDLANADRSLPFGAEIGRSEPLSVSAADLLVSADLATLESMQAATAGEEPSLAEDRAIRGLALSAHPESTLVQATILPGGMLGLGPDVYQLLTRSPEEAAQLLASMAEDFEAMPVASAIAILDGATAEEQIVSISLAFEDEADAAAAADILPRRLTQLSAPTFGAPLSSLLADRGVTSVEGTTIAGQSGVLPVARIDIHAPLAGPQADPEAGRPAASSSLYRLFVDLVMRRDLLWLAPVLPLE
jgi:hypothetical protein